MDETDTIRKRYDRVSKVYDFFEQPMETMSFKKWRVLAFQGLKGKVIEVGVGTGKNIPCYPDDVDMTAIDFSEKMLDIAREKAKRLHKKVQFIHMDVQCMDFPDDVFDQVITAFVFCSVPDPVKGLQEIRRVCKPGGKIIMIEHVRSEKKVLGLIMDLLNPIPLRIYGANINRRTVENVQKAGYKNIEVKNLMGDIVKKIVIDNGRVFSEDKYTK